MQTRMKLSINSPCHQNWQQMTSTEQGRFCNACQKEVVDFTKLSDNEVLHYFLHRKNENVCGRFEAGQLNRHLVKPVEIKRNALWYWNYLLVFMLLIIKGNSSRSQGITPSTHTIQAGINGDSLPILPVITPLSADGKYEVRGQVMDEAGSPIAFASVSIKGEKKGVVTDMNGRFVLRNVSIKDILVARAVGYASAEVAGAGKDTWNFILEMKTALTGEVVVVGGVSSDYDYSPPAVPQHVFELSVIDKVTGLPVASKLIIKRNSTDSSFNDTNKKGICKLRHIRPSDIVEVTALAKGYQSAVLTIRGADFNRRKESGTILIQPETVVQESGPVKVRLGMVSTNVQKENEYLFVIDGVLAEREALDTIEPTDIERIDIIKNDGESKIYSCKRFTNVIVITTKRKSLPNPSLKTDTLQHAKKLPVVSATGIVKLSPNPVTKGENVLLSFKSTEGAICTIRVVNATGVTVHTQSVGTKANNMLLLKTDHNWSKGVYFVNIAMHDTPVAAGTLLIE